MALIVQKFGGSSVADVGRLRDVAARVAQTIRSGHRVVVVVSAMGDTTDDLLALAAALLPTQSITPPPSGGIEGGCNARDLDLLLASGEFVSCSLLAIALNAASIPARAFTGPQAGIRTNGVFGNAEITGLDLGPLEAALQRGIVPVVAGFQGRSADGEFNTLGRGGSDTSAAALAAALHADWCEIYTDVDGVYTADPRIVPHARKLDRISYTEMLELAAFGANVLHPRAVGWAQGGNVPIVVRSSFSQQTGTLVADRNVRLPIVEASGVEWSTRVRGLALQAIERERSRVSLIGEGVGENVRLDEQMRVALRKAGLDFRPEASTHLRLSYILARHDAPAALRLLHTACALDVPPVAGKRQRPAVLRGNAPYLGVGAVSW